MGALKKAMIAAGAAGAIAVAYTVGAAVQGGPKVTSEGVAAPADETGLVVPDALPPLTVGLEVSIPNAEAVLKGEVKVPDSLLRPPEPPARPDLIVPDLSKK